MGLKTEKIETVASLDATTTATIKAALFPVNAQTGTTYTLSATDWGKTITLSNANPITLTCPQNTTEDLPDGFYCTLVWKGVGQPTVVKEGADNLRFAAGLGPRLRAQYSQASITKITDAEFYLAGDITA